MRLPWVHPGKELKIDGAFGWYYDNILTQYAMEWEIRKALSGRIAIDELSRPGTLPLREAIEKEGDPLLSGRGRCASITISTLMVFLRPSGYACLIRKRSSAVGVSRNTFHVVPAGMFEAKNSMDPWSVRMNAWRELLEEVYNEREEIGTGRSELLDYILFKEPVRTLEEMIESGDAYFSVTGLCCDLLNLRPEI